MGADFKSTHTLAFECDGLEWSGVFNRIFEIAAVEFTDTMDRLGESVQACSTEFEVMRVNAESAKAAAEWIASHAHSVTWTCDGEPVNPRDPQAWLRAFGLAALTQIAGAVAFGGDTSVEKKTEKWSARRT